MQIQMQDNDNIMNLMMPYWQDAEKKAEEVDEGEYGPEMDLKVPTTFQGWMALIGKTLAPAEEVSPFKVLSLLSF